MGTTVVPLSFSLGFSDLCDSRASYLIKERKHKEAATIKFSLNYLLGLLDSQGYILVFQAIKIQLDESHGPPKNDQLFSRQSSSHGQWRLLDFTSTSGVEEKLSILR